MFDMNDLILIFVFGFLGIIGVLSLGFHACEHQVNRYTWGMKLKKQKGCVCRCFDAFCQPDCKCQGHPKRWLGHRIDHIHRHEVGKYDG